MLILIHLISILLITFCHCGDNGSKKRDSTTYDFIIVGSGTAGSVVAAELARNLPDKQVLLIEEGYFSVANPNIDDVSEYNELVSDFSIEKGYVTTPQPQLNNRAIPYLRARVTGGCNSHNGQIWILANEFDFSEKWGDIPGWTLDDIVPVWDEVQSVAYWGANFNEIPSTDEPMTQRFIAAGESVGFKFNPNYNNIDPLLNGTQEGVSGGLFESEIIGPTIDANTGDVSYYVKRHSSWTDYVETLLKSNDYNNNLKILTMTRVDKLVFSNDNKRVIGVETYNRGNFERITYYANNEVILSAGAVDTPKLMLLSGIGDCSMLEGYSIQCKVDLPGVGQNLRDHTFVPYLATFVTNNDDIQFRIDLDFIFWGAATITEKGEILTYYVIVEISDGVYGLGVNIFLDHIYSTGNVTLADNNVESDPIINPNYLYDRRDIEALIPPFETVREFVFNDVFDGVFDIDETHEVSPGFSVQSDEDIEEFIRATATTGAHPVGTCKMGKNDDDDDMIVVTPELKVRNVENLRVIDASIMPDIVSANTNAMTMVIGLNGAKMIVNEYIDKSDSTSSSSEQSSSSSSSSHS